MRQNMPMQQGGQYDNYAPSYEEQMMMHGMKQIPQPRLMPAPGQDQGVYQQPQMQIPQQQAQQFNRGGFQGGAML
jgi:hypothetical protein